MEEFTEEYNKFLLAREWMAKVDGSTSTPYLLKYHFIPGDWICVIMVTDTKRVWAEVVSSKTMARRWRNFNPNAAEYSEVSIEENAWRKRVSELLSEAHTIGGIVDLDFEVVDSDYSDLSLRLEGETFKWKWETCFLGYQRSSEIISQHLIFPLISLTHLSFSSGKPFSELPDIELEKSIDRIGRTAKRAADTHVKNTIAKPVIATSIRRMSAIYHTASNLSSVSSIAEKPYLHIEEPRKAESSKKPAREKTPEPVEEPQPVRKYNLREDTTAPQPSPGPVIEAKSTAPEPPKGPTDGSETETDTDDDEPAPQAGTSKQPEPMQVDTPPARSPSHMVEKPANSDSEVSPVRPAKKKLRVSSDDDDSSGSESKGKRSGSGAPRGGGGGIKRGARQPIKRGGKRF
ncbi:hypothetical protein D9619_004909 [Psilocybe cf. subviscida]|uniref:XLF-like N-terminal domain-containing protein n=1 Tax=Psilocybe cf. subviscida TaxID=2480587 RepID=A0A8H5BRI5_9AGAR|nr:hypothetical protein D9619_004909 [Psilocybe cf. subviscida]